MLRRTHVAVLLLVAIVSCREAPTEPSQVTPQLAISDGATGGNEHFYFLPPLVPSPTYSGTFDPTLSPLVTITADGEPDIMLTPVLMEDHYHANWHAKDYALDASNTYRVTVSVNGFALGYADIVVGASGQELRNVNTGEFVPLVEGRTLPIKFRIEEAALPEDQITFTFSGFLTEVVDTQNTLEFPYAVGDPFTGTFSYPSDLIDGNPDPLYFFSSDSRVVASVTLTAHVFTGGSNGRVAIDSGQGQMSIGNWTTSITPPPQFLSSPLVQVLFKGRIVPFNDILPTTLRLEDFDSPVQMAMAGANTQGGDGISLRGTIDVLTQVAAP